MTATSPVPKGFRARDGLCLAMYVPISFRDGVELQHILGVGLWPTGTQAFAVDATIDHDMRYMNTQTSILARQALGDYAQPGFGSSERA